MGCDTDHVDENLKFMRRNVHLGYDTEEIKLFAFFRHPLVMDGTLVRMSDKVKKVLHYHHYSGEDYYLTMDMICVANLAYF